MDKERFYKTVIVVLLALVLTMALIMFLRKPAKKPGTGPVARVTRPVKGSAGKIAIVIDDVGYSLANLDSIEAIKGNRVTFSIIPGLNYSEEAARKLGTLGFQITLHLPMEPKEKNNLEPNTILTSMDEPQIKTIIDNDLASLPEVKGVNNHMGSKVTEDERTMSIVLDELKRKRLFFLDSFVTADSIAKKLAEQKKIKFAKRDVFLDNSPDPAYIRQQVEQLKHKARQKGQAIGIGHDRKSTLEVLKEEIPKMEKDGFKLVFISELAR
jgi:uncharacterized protein